jgi:RNA polymerase sigma-70 factor (ECF subfamily)
MLKAMNANELADDALMARIAHGDRVAFRMLTGRLYGPALRLAAKVLGDRAEAEDAVQAALVKLWQSAARFDAQRGSVDGWFRRVVVNACIDRRRTIKPVAPIEAAADAPSMDATPYEAAEANERTARVQAAMARLNPRQRAAIALFHMEGATMAEIAEALETTPKAVEGLLARARSELARMLAGTKEYQ